MPREERGLSFWGVTNDSHTRIVEIRPDFDHCTGHLRLRGDSTYGEIAEIRAIGSGTGTIEDMIVFGTIVIQDQSRKLPYHAT